MNVLHWFPNILETWLCFLFVCLLACLLACVSYLLFSYGCSHSIVRDFRFGHLWHILLKSKISAHFWSHFCCFWAHGLRPQWTFYTAFTLNVNNYAAFRGPASCEYSQMQTNGCCLLIGSHLIGINCPIGTRLKGIVPTALFPRDIASTACTPSATL